MLRLQKLSPRSFDWKLLGAVALLVIIGLAATYSVDLSRGSGLLFFKKQLIAAGIGFGLLLFAGINQHTLWQYVAKWSYLVSLILLVAVLLFGQTIRGTRGWFTIGSFSFQPVEVAKIGLILMLAYIISRFGRRFERPLFFFGTALVALVLAGLVMLQPDLGSAALLVVVWFGLVWLVGARRLYIGLFVLAVAAVSVIGWSFFLKEYQRERIMTFVNPARDPLGAGYNLTQSIIAVGAGKLYGRGLGFGSQSQLRFLPEAQTDFIFSVIGEELGFAGITVTLALFGVIFWRLIVLIKQANDDFTATATSGVLLLLFAQLVTNVGANLGLLPITGVTLPFVSYGGSSLVANLLMIGIVESMVVKRY